MGEQGGSSMDSGIRAPKADQWRVQCGDTSTYDTVPAAVSNIASAAGCYDNSLA